MPRIDALIACKQLQQAQNCQELNRKDARTLAHGVPRSDTNLPSSGVESDHPVANFDSPGAKTQSPGVKTPPTDDSSPPLVCVEDFAKLARSKLSVQALGYYSSGATAETTVKENKQAMDRWYIIPRHLRDVSQRSMATCVLGHQLRLPVAVAPTAMQRMAHPMGECASAKAAGAAGTVFTLSTISTSSLEEVAQYAPDTVKFFQLYIYNDRAVTEQLISRAENSGYKAIVLTVDAPTFGLRRADNRNKLVLPSHLKLANFDINSDKGALVNTSAGGSAINEYTTALFDASLTWRDLAWLIGVTRLPVIAKGIINTADAELAVSAGVAAVWVSNHGGRQVDGCPPTIEALPHIVSAVSGRCPVFVDGGFSEGTDVFKALALGADLVFIGRPVLWGLTCDGQRGVERVIGTMAAELDNLMANTGCSVIKDIHRSMVVRKDQYAKL